jgi:hypothetical protein
LKKTQKSQSKIWSCCNKQPTTEAATRACQWWLLKTSNTDGHISNQTTRIRIEKAQYLILKEDHQSDPETGAGRPGFAHFLSNTNCQKHQPAPATIDINLDRGLKKNSLELTEDNKKEVTTKRQHEPYRECTFPLQFDEQCRPADWR